MIGKFAKQCAVVAVALPCIYLVYCLAIGSPMSGIGPFCMVPIAVLGAYMWFGDNPSRFLNTPTRLIGEQLDRFCRYCGLWFVMASILMAIGLAILMETNQFILGIVLVIAPITLFIYPMRYLNKGVDDIRIPLENASSNAKLATMFMVGVVTLAPFIVLDGYDSNGVYIEWEEESFRVTAPMFDHTFAYDNIDGCELFPDFDRGIRTMGYATGEISSGKFKNDMFGKYELASYSKVSACIAISVDGNMYVFNQSTTAETEAAYQMILQKISS